MSKVSVGEEEYEAADLLAYQQFSLRLYELVLDAVDGGMAAKTQSSSDGAFRPR